MRSGRFGLNRRSSLGVLIGGGLAFVGAIALLLMGLTEQATTLLPVAVGIMLVGVATTVWSSRREADKDQ